MFVFAQDDNVTYRTAQVSFFYPLGTDWIYSKDRTYHLSLNMLAGANNGFDGFEAAGLVNINTGNIRGAQLAGIGSFTGANANEIAQCSGIINMVNGELTGFQAAGIVNVVNGNVNAVQFAGITNINTGQTNGLQAAGIANITGTGSDLFQIAGIANIGVSVNQGQVAGIANITNDTRIQVAGIGNAGNNIEGAQIGGIFNIARYVEGVQLAGILNICDSIDGIPLALVSIVKENGYRRFDIWHTEVTTVNLTFKTGIRQLYTMFSLGYNPNSDYNIYFGTGIGTSIQLTKHNYFDIEYHLYQATENWTIHETKLWNQLRFNISQQFGNRFAIYGGPTINMLISDKTQTSKPIAPNWSRKFRYNKHLTGWFGYNVGIRF